MIFERNGWLILKAKWNIDCFVCPFFNCIFQNSVYAMNLKSMSEKQGK